MPCELLAFAAEVSYCRAQGWTDSLHAIRQAWERQVNVASHRVAKSRAEARRSNMPHYYFYSPEPENATSTQPGAVGGTWGQQYRRDVEFLPPQPQRRRTLRLPTPWVEPPSPAVSPTHKEGLPLGD